MFVLFTKRSIIMTTDTENENTIVPKVWQLIDRGSMEIGDSEGKQEIQQMYNGVVELYHEFRPPYPEELIDQAIQRSTLLQNNPNDANILEIGCGPGTLTIALAKRGYNIVAIDPSLGMIKKARHVCKDYSNVQFFQQTLKEFSSTEKYDAIIAASSIHWALADGDKPKLVEKMANLLQEEGSLLLLWNFPPEPNDRILEKMADALKKPKPFHFGNGSMTQHWQGMKERVLGPIEDSSLFTPFETIEHPIEETMTIETYINLMNTLSNYISMEKEERESFFQVVRNVFREECGESITTNRTSIYNLSFKQKRS